MVLTIFCMIRENSIYKKLLMEFDSNSAHYLKLKIE